MIWCRWDVLRDPGNIRRLLQLVYADKGALEDGLVADIKAPTDHPGAAAAFASIIFAPKAESSFDQNLARCAPSSPLFCPSISAAAPFLPCLATGKIETYAYLAPPLAPYMPSELSG